MTGLFSRLAQQHLGRQSKNLKIARSPVFITEPDPVSTAFDIDENLKNESQEGADHEVHTENSSRESHTAETAPILSDPDKQDVATNTLGSELMPGSRTEAPPRQILSESLTVERDKSASSRSVTENSAGNFLRANSSYENRQTARDILPATRPGHEDGRSARSEGEKVNALDPSASGDRKVLHRPSSSVPAQLPASVSIQSNAKSETTRVSKELERNEAHTTTVNVTIGRVEVLAIQENSSPSAAKPQSRRKPILSLDEYQRKRQRGER